MKKNFLLVFLLALLPMAGWAQLSFQADNSPVTEDLPYKAEGYQITVLGHTYTITGNGNNRRYATVATDGDVTGNVTWQYKPTQDSEYGNAPDDGFVQPGYYKATNAYYDDDSGRVRDNPSPKIEYGEFRILPQSDQQGDDSTQGETNQGPWSVTLGASLTYKQIGDPDPEPQFSILWNDGNSNADYTKVTFSNLKLVRIGSTNPANDKVGDQIPYYIDYRNVVIKDQQGNDVTANYIVGTSSVTGYLEVTQKVLRQGEFQVIVSDEYTFDNLEKKPTNVKVQQDKNYDDPEAEPNWVDVATGDAVAANFTFTYENHVNADAYGVADEDGIFNYIVDKPRATVILSPKADGIYTSELNLGNGEVIQGVESINAEFKIKQKDITTTTIDIKDAVFNNAVQTPDVTISFENETETVTLVVNTDYTLAADEATAKYVTDAAKFTISAVEAGNYFNKVDKTFKIKKLAFALVAEDNSKGYGEKDPELIAKIVDPATGEAIQLPQELEEILVNNGTENEPSYYTVERVTGEHVGVYAIKVTGAALAGNANTAADPAHNYELTTVDGAFTIDAANNYYVSAKNVEKEYDGTAEIPFNGYWLYRGNTRLPEDDPAYKLIVGPTKNVLQANQNPTIPRTYVRGQDVLPADYRWRIQPDLTGLSTSEYTLNVRTAYNYQNQYDENLLRVTPKTVFVVADDLESAHGAELKTPTTTIYGYKTENGEKVIDKEKVLEVSLLYNMPTYSTRIITRDAAAGTTAPIQFDGYYGTGYYTRQTVANANPNYSITLVPGTYTITDATETIKVTLTWTKALGDDDPTGAPQIVVTHPYKENYSLTRDERDQISLDRKVTEGEEMDEYVLVQETEEADGDFTAPATLDNGYSVEYTAKLIITPRGEVTITLNNQTINYGDDIVNELIDPYAIVSGLNDEDFENLTITYVKPEIGFIKEGAVLQVTSGDVAIGEVGEDIVVTADEWPWVSKYEKVTVKGGQLYVNAADEITLNIVAFNKAKYNEDADISEQLIKDYHGSAVKSVTVIASEQDENAAAANQYTVKGDQWYSMVLPFETTPRQISALFNGYAAVDILNTKNGASKASEIRFSLTMSPIAANVPFVAKTDNDFVWKPVTINATDDEGILIEYPVDGAITEDANGNQFVGTYSAFFAPDATGYDLINLSKGAVSPATQDAYVRPLGAYIKMAEGYSNANARVFFEEADGTVTAIDAVKSNVNNNADGMYNLNGMKLQGAPAQKGVYIQNGKKVVIK